MDDSEVDEDDTNTGFAFAPDGDWEPDLAFARDAAEVLNPLDLGERPLFTPEPRLDLGEIGGRFRPDDGDLRIGTDDDRLRADLAKLREHEADLKLRALLGKAERAFGAEQFPDALTHVEAALEIAPTNVTALLLGARCKSALRAFGDALDLLTTARQYAQETDEVTLVLRLRDTCEIALIDQVTEHVRGMVAYDRTSEAVEYVERMVARHLEVLGLRYVHGAALFLARRLTEARAVVETAMASDLADGVESFAELHQSILSELFRPQVELARQSLRARKPKAAIEHLVECGDALHANRRYGLLWSYAHERYAKSSKVPFVGWRRARRAEARPLDVDGMQDVLMWVLAEEVDAGVAAFRGSDFAGASHHCRKAEAIDSRCGTIAYLHAMAETCAADAFLKQVDMVTLATAGQRLATAAALVPKIAQDPALIEKSQLLATRIKEDRAEVARLTKFIGCLTRFTNLSKRYEHRRIVTRNELYVVKGELRSILRDARASKRDYESDSQAQQTLDHLIRAVEGTLRHLPA